MLSVYFLIKAWFNLENICHACNKNMLLENKNESKIMKKIRFAVVNYLNCIMYSVYCASFL